MEKVLSEVNIIITDDGSHTLHDPELNETYHSTHGAIRESRHVFIENGLNFYVETTGLKEINLLEVGFGTGLNVLMTYEYCLQHPEVNIKLTTLEPFPLSDEILDGLNYISQSGLDKQIWLTMHKTGWNIFDKLLPNFSILKLNEKVEEFKKSGFYDIVYFDAFAPGKQPEIWSEDVFRKLYSLMSGNSILTTYCAQGQFKRTLRATGFKVEGLPGPPGKKEMVRAFKGEIVDQSKSKSDFFTY